MKLSKADLEHMLRLGPESLPSCAYDRALVQHAEHMGFGRALQLIAGAWGRKDPIGAFTIGPCRGTLASEVKP